MACAVGHLYEYPAELLRLPAPDAAEVLNAVAGRRSSSVRGVFRTALPIHPRRFPLQFVPTQPNGIGVADKVAALLPHADEAVAAREFARALGVAPVASFAALSEAVGMPLYWLGRFKVEVRDLVHPHAAPPCTRLFPKAPKRPGARHALVLLYPDIGLFVLSTWPPVRPDQHNTTSIYNVSCRGRLYGGEEVENFARRLRAARAKRPPDPPAVRHLVMALQARSGCCG